MIECRLVDGFISDLHGVLSSKKCLVRVVKSFDRGVNQTRQNNEK